MQKSFSVASCLKQLLIHAYLLKRDPGLPLCFSRDDMNWVIPANAGIFLSRKLLETTVDK